MQTRYIFLLKFVLILTDLLFLNFTFVIANKVSQLYDFGDTATLYRYYLPVVNLLWLLSGAFFRLYLQTTLDHLENIYRATLRTVFLHAILFAAYLLLAHGLGGDANTFLLSFYGIFGVFLLGSRLVGTYIQGLLEKHFRIRKTVAIMGKNE